MKLLVLGGDSDFAIGSVSQYVTLFIWFSGLFVTSNLLYKFKKIHL